MRPRSGWPPCRPGAGDHRGRPVGRPVKGRRWRGPRTRPGRRRRRPAGAVGVGEQQVHRADQHGGQRSDVSAGRDPPEVPLGGEVPADHGRGLGEERDARAGGGAQPGAQLVPRDDQPDEREDRRAEQPGDRGREVAATLPVPAAARSSAAWLSILAIRSSASSARNASKSAKCRCSTLGDPGLGGDRPAGQRGRAVAEQDPLGGVEQLPARVADGHSGGHVPSVLPCAVREPAV